jgi:tetratricopeptide (TPR) repeat protein
VADLQKPAGDISAQQSVESSPSGIAESWVELDKQARDFFTQGRFAEAIVVLDRAIEIDPRNGNAYLRRAVCNWADASKAVADATRALELQCDLPAKAYSARGRAQFFLKNFRAGADDASKAIEMQPDASEPYTVRGLARLGLGENNGALTDFNKAIALDPKNGEAYFGRGNYYATIRAMDEADEEWKRAVELQPSLKPAVDGARSWFAQGGAKTAQSTTSAASGSTTGSKASPEKRDLRSRLLGKWKGGRHTTLFSPDGTFILDPDLTPQPIRESVATWRVEGDQLIQNVAGRTLVSTIVSVTELELVLKDANGTWRLKRVK